MSNKLYIDSCILVSYFDENDTGTQHKETIAFLDKCEKDLSFELCLSSWTLTESMKVLLVSKNFIKSDVLALFEELLRKKRLGNVKITILPDPKKPKYDLDEFFYDVQKKILRYRIGVGDLMHLVIMDLHDIKTIITFNDKDFKKFKETRVIQPKNIGKNKF